MEQGINSQGVPLELIDWLENSIDPDRLIQSIRARMSDVESEKQRILHVEDDPDVTEVVSTVLQPEMMHYEVASSVAEARERLQNGGFDLVILDIGLPDGSGVELLPDLKRPDGSSIPVVIFSAYDIDPEIIRRVDATLVKSRTDNDHLLSMIQAILRKGDVGNR